MEQVVDSVTSVTAIMAAISDASREQSICIGHVNQAITEMDAVTQQNAALVEQAAAAAESLQEHAQALAQSVKVFHLKGEAAAHAQRPQQAGRAAAPARLALPGRS